MHGNLMGIPSMQAHTVFMLSCLYILAYSHQRPPLLCLVASNAFQFVLGSGGSTIEQVGTAGMKQECIRSRTAAVESSFFPHT